MATPRQTGVFCWAELGTSDSAGARSFYQDLFGWTSTDKDMGEMGVYSRLSLGGEEFGGLYAMHGPMFEGVPPHWMFYIKVDDVDATCARAKELGGKEVWPAMDVPDVGRIGMIEDPTGAKIGISACTIHPGATAALNATDGFGWIELQTRDVPAAKAFYTELFGWRDSVGDDPMGYVHWEVGEGEGKTQFGGMMKMDDNWGDAPPSWLGYVMVGDCDATFAKATEKGGHAIVPPMTIEGTGRFAVISDPQGAVFAFMELAEGIGEC